MDRRVCYSCRFYRPFDGRAIGRCHHPAREALGRSPLVRAGELRCRRGFESDDWMPASLADSLEGKDIVLSERPAPFRRRRPRIVVPVAVIEDQPAAG